LRNAFSAVLALILCVPTAAGGQTNRTSWKSDSALVFLHRSACMVAPENTVPAFEAAVRQGADGIEIDIRKTVDGVLVIYHDDWVLRQRGPTGKIEEMTLAETQRLDVGERFGPQWRGTRIPLFEDLLRFAKANGLRLYLDIKSKGIYDEVMQLVRNMDCLPLVHATGGQVPANSYHLSIPWISGWNYTEGGEEDPAKMRDVISRAPEGIYAIMCDDARSVVRVLGRKPEQRFFTPFVSSIRQKLKAVDGITKPSPLPLNPIEALSSAHAAERRAACIALAAKPLWPALDRLMEIAENDPDYIVRQEACWALGSRRQDRTVPTLLRIALTRMDPASAAQHGYRDTFLKIAAACALARQNSDAGRAALRTLMHSGGEFDRGAASVGISAFGTEKDIPAMVELVSASKANDGFPAGFVAGYAGRFGVKSIPIYIAALERDDTAKVAVFGLAAVGRKAVPALTRLAGDSAASEIVRSHARLTLEWM
jgi:hypothetical protein